jgi:hypothetical protein
LADTGELRYSPSARLPNLRNRATEKQRALVHSIALQSAQHEDKPLEICKAYNRVQIEMTNWTVRLAIVKKLVSTQQEVEC